MHAYYVIITIYIETIKERGVFIMNYDGRELLQAIIMTEENKAKFYRDLSQKVDNKTVIDIFYRLSDEEDEHIKFYAEILEKLPQNGALELSKDEVEYTEVLINSNVFANQKLLKRYLKKDALLLAEKVEKDSILFCQQLSKLYPDTMPDKINSILNDEKRHLKIVLDNRLNCMFPDLGLL